MVPGFSYDLLCPPLSVGSTSSEKSKVEKESQLNAKAFAPATLILGM